MSVFIEEILTQLQPSAAGDELPSQVLSTILVQLEGRPLRSSERRLVQKEFLDYLQAHDIRTDSKLAHQINQRMQFDYFPGIATAGISTTPTAREFIPEVSPITDTDAIGGSDCVISSTTISNLICIPPLFSTSSTTKCYLCTLHRHKSTLWTTYRLFLDGYKDSHEATSPMIRNSEHVLVLAARKMISGISNQYLMWSVSDSKLWKEKSAIGKVKISKLSQSTSYLCRCLDSIYSAETGASMAIRVNSRGIDKLIHIVALLPRIDAAVESDEFCANDKETPPSTSESFSVDFSPVAAADAVDADYIRALDLIVSKGKQPDTIEPNSMSMRVLRSIPPRKLLSAIGSASKAKAVHTLAFSHDCRVRAPSRKNIVIEATSVDSTKRTDSMLTWTGQSGPVPNPLFQACAYLHSCLLH